MVLRILLAAICLATVGPSLCEETELKRYAEKAKDVEPSGSDFVAHFHPFRFQPPPVFTAPQDLTALQQTHVLGFHHRFHAPRFSHFGSPIIGQAPIFQNQPGQLRQVLIPPQPVRPQVHQPPPPSPNPVRHPQNHNQLFQQHSAPADNFRDHNVRFSQQNFVGQATNFQQRPPNQQFVNNPPANNQFSQQHQQHRFNAASQFQQQRPVINQQPATSHPSAINQRPVVNQHSVAGHQQTFRQPTPIPPTVFSNDIGQGFVPTQPNFFPPKVTFNNFGQQSILRNPDPVVHSPKPPVFSPTSLPKINEDVTSHYRVNIVHQSQTGHQNILPQPQSQPLRPQTQPIHQQQSQSVIQQQPQSILQQQSQSIIQQQPQSIIQHIPQSILQQQTQPILQPQPQSILQPQPVLQQQPLQPTQPIQKPTFELQPSVANKQQPAVLYHQTEATTSQPTISSDDVVFQRSEEKPGYKLNGDFFNLPKENKGPQTTSNQVNFVEYYNSNKENEVPQATRPTTQPVFIESFNTQREKELKPTPRPTTQKTYVTVAPTKTTKTPKPIVKEIRINLNEEGLPVKDGNPQLYIKDTRQKQFQEIKQQQQQSEKKAKSQKSKTEKTQEELINDQIRKLLQSHNLEIIGKDKDSSSESQESQLSQFSRTLKGKYNIQLLSGSSILKDTKKKKQGEAVLPPLPDLPEHIKKDYDVKLVNRDDFFQQFDIIPDQAKHGKFGNNSIYLANGQELELVTVEKDGTMKKIAVGTKSQAKKSVTPTSTTPKPPKVLFEELAKGAIPPGAEFEIIRHNANGEIEKVTDLTTANKATFVLLEEQPDGTVRVQGVKGEQLPGEKDSVNSLIKKIKDGSLKLPPSTGKTKANSILTNEIPKSTDIKSFVTIAPTTGPSRTVRYFPSTFSTPSTQLYEETFTEAYSTASYSSSTPRLSRTKARPNFLPTVPPIEATVTTTFASRRIKPTLTSSTPSYFFRSSTTPKKSSKRVFTKLSSKYDEQAFDKIEQTTFRTTLNYANTEEYTTALDGVAQESKLEVTRPLIDVLKSRGLSTMAKFLDQSGLDTILNETGPYTIFIPTNKAFKELEAQLGGMDKAEDKFRENPRLLSGLLLHHVVPGSFRVGDLLDEMTGVSLAGTQLRVNTYGEKKAGERLVTINGATISHDLKDISVPQGIAHAVDRVLFPLPVGDILQTLRGDRERRFTKFIKSLEASGLTEMLKGSKTYTVFAPVDSAFSALTDSELDKLLTRREAARTIVLRHLVPGTLYSAGMRYYQVKDTMEEGQKITIHKELGKIKANAAQVISSNIPATNGVIHAVESLL